MAVIATNQLVSSGSAQQLDATNQNPSVWVLKASSANSTPVYVGPIAVTTGNGHVMSPGDEITFDLRITEGGQIAVHPRDLYVVGSGGVISWLGFL